MKAAEMTPLLKRDLARAEVADDAGQHPGHDELRDEGDDEGHGARGAVRLELLLGLADGRRSTAWRRARRTTASRT